MVYEGFFLNDSLQSSLEEDIEFKHVTVQYKPRKEHRDLYGAKARFRVVGYGKDEENEGLRVYLVTLDVSMLETTQDKAAEILDLYHEVEVPHITLSVSKEGKPVNTKNLEFSDKIPKEYDHIISCTFGGFDGTSPVLH